MLLQTKDTRANALVSRRQRGGAYVELGLAKLVEDRTILLATMAITFTICRPGVSSAIIGPRIMEQRVSQLEAATVTLDDAWLNRIGAILFPETNVSPAKMHGTTQRCILNIDEELLTNITFVLTSFWFAWQAT
jgi:aryl-alcohol dehydrogenase-like predicted oxidoreductase